MTLSAKTLKKLWYSEEKHYKKTELGTGVQSFVKKTFESNEIFNLKEGKLSTKLQNRNNEFIYEKNAKEKARADFYIYINSEIAIPVEVERYGNIKAGESQLLKYQIAFDKQYGILTDGYVWRFYNNNIYKTYTLETILDKTQLFLDFWKEYVKPEYYYLSFFEKTGQLALIEETILPVEKNHQTFFEDITKLIGGFKNKLQIEGYLESTEDKTKEQRSVELTYAYIIQFILYKTLVDNKFGKFPQEFEELVNDIHKNLQKKDYKNILGPINGISDQISKNIYRPFNKEQEFINKKIFDLLRGIKNSLSDVSPWLDIFIFIKKYNFANVKNEIFGFIYENYLKELYQEDQKGQYFTDPAVVNFMLEQIGYTSEMIRKKYETDKTRISLIDPSCGSGTFLYSATDILVQALKDGYTEEASKKIEEAVANNIFGLDIEEFPLYLAEMSILMRLLPLIVHQRYNNPVDKKIKIFKTLDSISEFMDTALKNTKSDIEVETEKSNGQMTLFTPKLNLGYSSYIRDEDDLKEMKKSLENLSKIPRKRFDYVIGNPPYITYNKCSKQKILIFELMKKGKAKLSDIYGVNLHSTPKQQKKYAPKPNFYTFFIALGLALLKDNGKICYIVPQTILTSGDLDTIKYHLAKFTTIEKIFTFPGALFTGRGLKQKNKVSTSSLIFVVSKKIPSLLHKIQIINYEDSSENLEDIFKNITNNKKIKSKKILQTKLLNNAANWSFIKFPPLFADFYETYLGNSKSISIYYNHVSSEKYFKSNFYFDKGLVFPKKSVIPITQILDDNYFKLTKLNKKHYLASLKQQAINKKDIRLPHGSQGLEVFNKKYKIIWRYMNYNGFFFSDQKIMIDFNYVVISSDNNKEMLYLLSILNSSIIKIFLEKLFKTESEKDILLGIKTIKEFVRVPKITKENLHLKNKIIELTKKLLDLEKILLSELIDFSSVMVQKFNSAKVENGCLVLKQDGKEIILPIKKSKKIVEKTINDNLGNLKLGLEDKKIILSELMTTPVVDFQKQVSIKNQIDNLILALYFNIKISKNKLNEPEEIEKVCQKTKNKINL